MNWGFLDTLNTTAFKGWSVGWLWIYTGAIWGIVAIVAVAFKVTPPTEWLIGWLGGLTAYSGVSAYAQKVQRETDYGYIERKGAANVPSTVTNVQPGAVNVAASQTTDTTPDATVQVRQGG